MKVLLLSAEYPPQPGGIGDYTRRLGASLTARGQPVFVGTIDDLRLTIHDLSDLPVTVHRPPSTVHRPPSTVHRQSNWGWASWRMVLAAIRQLQPAVLHIQYQTGAYGMHPAINLLPWRLGWQRQRPVVVVTAHDLLPPYLFPKAGALRSWVTRRLLADADAAIATNPTDLAQMLAWQVGRGQHAQRPSLIPIGSNIDPAPAAGYQRAAYRAQLGIGPGETVIAYFGLLGRSKGVDMLLDALVQLPTHYRLLLVGGAATAPADQAYAAEVRARLAAGPLAQRVQITGQLAAAEVSAHLLAADLAALPFSDGASFRRGSLLAVLAHGLPLVSTHAPAPQAATHLSLPRLVDGENLLLIPPGDSQALAAAIRRLASDPALRQRLAVGGQALAAQFGWEAIAAQHEALYQRCLSHTL